MFLMSSLDNDSFLLFSVSYCFFIVSFPYCFLIVSFCLYCIVDRLGFAAPTVDTRPNPSAQSTIVVFVVGGISLNEASEVQREIASYITLGTAANTPKKIILGSTCLSSPELLMRQVFAGGATH